MKNFPAKISNLQKNNIFFPQSNVNFKEKISRHEIFVNADTWKNEILSHLLSWWLSKINSNTDWLFVCSYSRIYSITMWCVLMTMHFNFPFLYSARIIDVYLIYFKNRTQKLKANRQFERNFTYVKYWHSVWMHENKFIGVKIDSLCFLLLVWKLNLIQQKNFTYSLISFVYFCTCRVWRNLRGLKMFFNGSISGVFWEFSWSFLELNLLSGLWSVYDSVMFRLELRSGELKLAYNKIKSVNFL